MKLFNTLTRKKEDFIPTNDNKVGIYACGPTVYDYFHIGNARAFVVFDTFRRFLEFQGYDVMYIQNFTDIDDKMINRANEENITVKELADKFIDEYFNDADSLGVKRANIHPKATEHVQDMIDMIQKLIDKGLAYVVDGDVYFNTRKFADYGKLSHQDLDELESGARVEVSDKKYNPMDFVLWKAKKEGEPGWESPWGEGRPGWHIECSVMATKYLGETIDIHVGGQDLIFPHHENEIAQSEGANEKPFVRYWLHNGFLNIDNEKMSKSLGNFFTARDLAQEYDYEVLRFSLLSVHYRNPMNFTKELMDQSKSALERLYNCYNNLLHMRRNSNNRNMTESEKTLEQTINKYRQKFIDSMEDDINTADAIASLFEIIREVNSNLDSESSEEIMHFCIQLINELTEILGILQNTANESLDEEIEQLIQKRQEARKNKDFELADKIRDQLRSMGIIIEDTPQGVRWKREH